MKLTAKNVHLVLMDCLTTTANREEVQDGVTLVPGAIATYVLAIDPLESHYGDIVSMLRQLDDDFMQGGGGGMSLARMVLTKEGVQWGEQYQADQLYVLGAGLKLCRFCLSRELWDSLPGGLPYITVTLPTVKGALWPPM